MKGILAKHDQQSAQISEFDSNEAIMNSNHQKVRHVLVAILITFIIISSSAQAQSPTPLPVLFILLEIGPGGENDFHPKHNVDHYRGLLNGVSNFNKPNYFNSINLSNTPGGIQGNFSADNGFPIAHIDNFAIHAETTLQVQSSKAGYWTIGVNSDGGSRVTIDGEVVIDDPALGGAADNLSTILLTKGTHQLEIISFHEPNTATLELFAAPGEHAAFGPNFNLISFTNNPGLTIQSPFTVRQRAQRPRDTDILSSLPEAQMLMQAPFHNVVDYFSENTYNNVKLVPAVNGDFHGKADGIVGPFTQSQLDTTPEVKRHNAIKMADSHFNFLSYDTNANTYIDADELLVVVVMGQAQDNEHDCTVRPKDEFDVTTFRREQTTITLADGRVLGVNITIGRATSNDADHIHQYHYYARVDNPARHHWSRNDAQQHCIGETGSADAFRSETGGANVRGIDKSYYSSDGVKFRGKFEVAGVSQWAGWMNLVHEISHLLSDDALDLYNFRDVGGYFVGLDTYDVMASGGHGTAHHNPWTKLKNKWLSPTEVTSPGWFTLKAIETSPDVLRIDLNDQQQEYLLLENRWRGSSYDNNYVHLYGQIYRANSGIKDEGLGIYHIDESRFSAFKSNDFRAPPFIQKINADGTPKSDAEDLWKGDKSFKGHSTHDGVKSNVKVTCITPPGPNIKAYVDFSNNDLPYDDRFEPNNEKQLATSVILDLNENELSIHHRECDRDLFTFALSEYTDITVETNAFSDALMEQPVQGPNLFLWQQGSIIAQGQGTLSLNSITPATTFLEVSATDELFYNLTISGTDSTIAPDKYDDQQPPGELRNDDLMSASKLPMVQGPLLPQIEFDIDWLVMAGGRSIDHIDYNLNFDHVGDVDTFKIKVDLASFSYTSRDECPSSSVPSDFNIVAAESGKLEIMVLSNLNEPVDVRLFDANLQPIAANPGIDIWSTSSTAGARIYCPSKTLSQWPNADGEGILYLSIDPNGVRNFYDIRIRYQEGSIHAVHEDVPLPVWNIEPVQFILPSNDPVRYVYPKNPLVFHEQCPAGHCDELPADSFALAWPERQTLLLDVQVTDEKTLYVQLLDHQDEPVANNLRIEKHGRLRVDDLAAGLYKLEVRAEHPATHYSLGITGSGNP